MILTPPAPSHLQNGAIFFLDPRVTFCIKIQQHPYKNNQLEIGVCNIMAILFQPQCEFMQQKYNNFPKRYQNENDMCKMMTIFISA